MTHSLRIFPPSENATGWLPGAPPHVPANVVRADRRVYARCRCPACGRRGLRTAAQHNGPRYRVVGRCGWCGAVEVF
jgi:hypothetical protein